MIHPQAIIEKAVILGQNVKIGPYAVLEKGVILGNNVVVSPFVHLKGNTYIGEDTFIGTGAVIGEGPQMLGVKENIGKVQIGRNNIIREYVTINSASSADKA
ncbi:MAG: acyl-[acyl-carrier-protein]--UDP-N-acetylglucosamine O-acyltransferase, partial [Omnitrophica bacterium]|nr:acyl-[acyl-carrier-protein]--UDP-N-acetylglucosamine O-acyltransferase [Candidatus Omnitrophota bacterium]